jgi:predicted PurR-regulated permease PerM
MPLAAVFFVLAASGTSFAFIGWIMGFLLLVLALILLTGEPESRGRDRTFGEDRG